MISDAIDAAEELQFAGTRYREEAESAFQHFWRLYTVLSQRAIQGHASVESLASVSTRVSVRTLASISSRIAECSAHYAEDDGELIGDSNDPIRWLEEQASRADQSPLPISAHVLSDHEDEDTTSEDDSIVRVGTSELSTLIELMVHRTPHQLIPPKPWKKIKCLLPQC